MHLKLTRYIPAVFALAVLAGIGAMSFAGGPAKVSAANTETATVTFTKWVIGYPMLAGFVSGDVGSGSFTGEVISRDPTVAKGKIIEIEAIYQFKGNSHAFDSLVHVRQNAAKGTAVVTGLVTDGWMEGAQISGEFKTIKCDESPSKACFQGALNLYYGPLY